MNKSHDRYWRMFNNVETVLDENSAVWTLVPIITEQKNLLDELIQRIEEVYGNNHADANAITRNKANIKEALMMKASILAAALYVYGDMTNNEVLKSFKKVSKWNLDNMKETELVSTTQSIIQAANENREALAPFAVAEPQITELETSLDDFSALIGQARNVRNNVYANIKEADQLFDEANNLLRNRMDKVMRLFEINNPKFFDLYTRARVIVN
ncbi:hypothetical protein [Carboxylicivirga marina]|uniref:hypothetical protein n=1 Tax=Carboxylicivirga marina TaxID=2800988 RepID=UPI00259685B9|nr:hypothetical protein [uncultured Carboxylicivirga sp.]